MKERVDKLDPVFVVNIPKDIEDGILYVSEKFKTCIHNCACGCKNKVVLPFGKHEKHWEYKRINDLITIRPSVGNWSFPCKSHYYITNNNIDWL